MAGNPGEQPGHLEHPASPAAYGMVVVRVPLGWLCRGRWGVLPIALCGHTP